MSTQTDTIIALLQPFDISSEEAVVYLHLIRGTHSTALSISREIRMARTKVYRILDKLIEKQLIEKKFGGRGLEFGAAPPHRLQKLAIEKELEAKAIKQSLPAVVAYLEQLVPKTAKHSKVLYYEGVSGLEQVTYNTVHTDGILRVYEIEHMSDFIDPKFSENLREQYVERNIYTRDLTNKPSFAGFTDIKELIQTHSEFRYIDPAQLDIRFEALIYNDVYATYTCAGDEIFCVEIYNEQLAQMQKQLYDFVWNQATPMKYTDERGSATLK